MAVVIDTEYVLCGVPALLTLAHLGFHLLARGGHTVVPDTSHACVALPERAVTFVTEEGRELRFTGLAPLTS